MLDAQSPTAVGLLWGKKNAGRSGVMSLMTNVESRLGGGHVGVMFASTAGWKPS